ncbi:polyprenyl synthetase family protein [Clostridium ganghwense]|uniref:Polyprenyl synthetase family protein n=1 Tax=Clostridium ganghwense TaxID=312089 RepID=A0ABT4CUD1_9CLOT|nr:polyprenyl synthetase family protein [Clostridium ganghwense]MCY6372665.1 polyprenyl synthetase family protein [Clostridium ganghwense]
MSNFWIDYPQVLEELTTVKSIIKKNIKTSEKHFEESIAPFVEQGGKMLRPAFLLLAAKFGEYDEKKMYNLAATIEMLHLATLVHDDIIDDSEMRRGVETIQSKYGKEYAVYVGDFLLCQSVNMISKYDYKMDKMRKISKAIRNICMGEIRQYHFRYIRKVDIRKYIRIISAKTAALFVLSFSIGAEEAGCNESIVRLFGRIGYNIGMAFQVIDDLLDYTGDTEKLGKSAQMDLKQGYYTLPIIFALEEDKNREIANILEKESFDDDDVKKIISLIKKYGGIEKTKKVADRYTKRAFENIDKLPDCESKDILKQIVEKLIHRNY